MAGNNSIQFVRGNNISGSDEELLPGQPAYDLTTKYLYVGDGSKISETSPIKASFADDAENVTSTINGKNISDIFEENGTTAKEATNSPKSLYNLGAFDTYVDNGDGTVTVTRKTGYYKIDGNFTVGLTWGEYPNLVSVKIPNVEYETDLVASIITVFDVWNDGNPQYDYAMDDHTDSIVGVRVVVKNATSMQEFRNYVSQNPISVEYELQTSEQYTEKLPANVPLNTLDANMSDIVRDEVEKTLNLADWDGTEDYTTAGNAWKYLFIAKVDIGKNYYFTINNFTQSRVGYGGLFLCQNDTTEIPVLYQNLIGSEYQIQTWEYSANGNLAVNFTPSKEYVLLGFSTDGSTKTIHVEDIMLVEGSHAYPYQPYNGAIVHEKQLNDALEDYLPLTGGNMSGNVLFGGTADGGNYYLSMGRGSQNGAGLHGVKIIVQHAEATSEQEFTSGLGQDLLLPDGCFNELDIVTCSENDNAQQNQGIIAFLHHYDNTPSDYSLLGYIDRDGNLRMQGQVIANAGGMVNGNLSINGQLDFSSLSTRAANALLSMVELSESPLQNQRVSWGGPNAAWSTNGSTWSHSGTIMASGYVTDLSTSGNVTSATYNSSTNRITYVISVNQNPGNNVYSGYVRYKYVIKKVK